MHFIFSSSACLSVFISVPSARSARPSYARGPTNVAANNANNANQNSNIQAHNGVSESISSKAPEPVKKGAAADAGNGFVPPFHVTF